MKSRSLIVNPPPALPTSEGRGPHLSLVLTGTVCLIISDVLVARGGKRPSRDTLQRKQPICGSLVPACWTHLDLYHGQGRCDMSR